MPRCKGPEGVAGAEGREEEEEEPRYATLKSLLLSAMENGSTGGLFSTK